MAWYLVGKWATFLPVSRYHALNEEALRGKTATWTVSSTIAGTKECVEAHRLRYQTLKRYHDHDRERFHQEWVRLDLAGDDASENVWMLLRAYCACLDCGRLSAALDTLERITWDRHYGRSLVGEAALEPVWSEWTRDDHSPWTQPMGKVFALDHIAQPAGWCWPWTPRRTVRIIVVATNVFRLLGELSQFEVFSTDFTLRCATPLEVLPPGLASKAENV